MVCSHIGHFNIPHYGASDSLLVCIRTIACDVSNHHRRLAEERYGKIFGFAISNEHFRSHHFSVSVSLC